MKHNEPLAIFSVLVTFLTHTVQMKQNFADFYGCNTFIFLTHTVQMKPG